MRKGKNMILKYCHINNEMFSFIRSRGFVIRASGRTVPPLKGAGGCTNIPSLTINT